MAERGKVELRSLGLAPDLQHVPEADVIEDYQGIWWQLDCGQIPQEFWLEALVLGSVVESAPPWLAWSANNT